ncbi:FlxA-like family protein [Xanthobacter sediminis]|uniref:FlxA-like family protein n=1 Tax=Xanthobacter sediminis TaxID=3119926 RepID=UPI003728DC15
MVSVSSVSTTSITSGTTSGASDLAAQIARLKASQDAYQKQIDDAQASTELSDEEKQSTVKAAEANLKQVAAQITELTARLAAQRSQESSATSNTNPQQQQRNDDDSTNPYAILSKTDLSILNESNG